MSRTQTQAALITPADDAEALAAARRRQIRHELAKAIEAALVIGDLDDACACATLSDRNYLSALVDDLMRHLKKA